MRRIPFALALAFALLVAPTAHAAFPGANGRIAFTRGSSTTEEIWTAQADGGDPQPLTSNSWGDRMPAYSPDGTKIAFVSLENAGDPEIYVMDADGSDPVRLTTSPGNDLDPAWSHDGTKIAFMSNRAPASNPEIYVMPATGGSATRLTNNAANDLDPAWSPDGTKIAFESTRIEGNANQNSEIFVMSASGAGQTPLTSTSSTNQDPSWSPDSTQIAFMRDAGDAEIYTMNANGTGEANRSDTAGNDLTPAFSPDGQRIAFTTNRPGQFEIYTMAANGTDQQRLTTSGPQGSQMPDWQPAPKGAEPDPTGTAQPTATATPAPGGGGTIGRIVTLFEGGGPPAATCTKSSVRFGEVEALAACFSAKGKANVATGRVRVNGLDLVPTGGEIAIDPDERTITSTRPVRVSAGKVPLFLGRIDWDLSRGRFEIPLDTTALQLIRIQGTATVTTDGLGRFRIAVLPRIDTIFETFAARLGAASRANLRLPAITGDAVLRTENARGLSLDTLSVTATSVPIGLLEVRELTLDFDPAAGNWSGKAKLRLPGPPPQVTAEVAVVVSNGSFERASLQAGNSLGTYGFGIRLERLRLDVRTNPFQLGGELALGAGPSLPGLGQLIRVDGKVDFTAGNPAELRIRGRTQVGPATGTASYTASSTGRQDFAGNAAVDLRFDTGLSAAVTGVVQPTWFLVQGNARARVLGLSLQGNGLFSNIGLAACVPVGPFRVGFGYRYSTKRLDLMAASCDVGPWRPVASAAQSGALGPFTVPAGLPGMVLEVAGSEAPPLVTIAGPGGVRATAPAEGGKAGDVLFLRDVEGRITYVVVPAPRAGRWTLTLEPGSSPATGVRRGDGLPAPNVKARVTGRGAQRTLRWNLRAVPGQVVRFAEEGRGAAKAITTTRKARGSVRFRPADGPAGKRSIVALVEQAGLPRARIVAGRDTAPAPQRPATPKRLTLKRRGSTLQVGWRRAAGASAYRVRAELSDGRRLLLTVRGRSLRVPAFGPRESAKVSVAGVRGPYEGRAASTRIRRARR